MNDEHKTREQLLANLAALRERVVEFEAADTERKRVEGEATASFAKFVALLENTNDHILICDQEGLPVVFNSAYARIMHEALGIEMKPGLQPHKLLSDQHLVAWWDDLHRRVLAGESFRVDFSFPFGEDDLRHFGLAYNPIMVDGEVQGFIEISRDITERIRVKEALLKSQTELLEAQRIAHIGNWSNDLVTGVIQWSEESFRLVGREPQEITPELVFSCIHPDDHSVIEMAMVEAQEGKNYSEHEFRVVRPDGEVRHIHNRWVSIYDESGQEIKRVGTHQDITERKRAEEALREGEQDARAFQEKLKALHEITIELSQTATLDDLYRRAVELGCAELGFDRLGLWLLSEDGETMVGTFGIDEDGNLRDERGLYHATRDDPKVAAALRSKERVAVWQDTPLQDDRLHEVGRGWEVFAAMWDGAQSIGWLSADNLLQKKPLASYDPELLTLYGTTLGYLVTRKRAEDAVREREQDAREFQAKLKALHEIGIELSQTATLDDLYRRAVELGRSELGFDRLGLWLISEDGEMMLGTFGTDKDGHLSDERSLRNEIAHDPWIMEALRSNERVTVWQDRALQNIWQEVGRGWGAMASMWDGARSIGWVAADNLIHQKPLASYEPELLTLYGTTLGHLVTRKRAEEALAQERNLLRTMIDNLPDSIYVKDTEGRFLLNNPGSMRSLGVASQDELEGKTDFDFFPDEAEEAFADEQVIMRSGQGRLNWEMRSPDGWLLVSKVPLRNNHGDIVGLVGINRNITERKRAEEALRQREEIYRTLVEMSLDGISLMGLEGTIRFCNRQKATMFGYAQADDLVGMGGVELIVPEEREKIVGELTQIFEKGVISGVEFTALKKDGTRFLAEISAALIRDENGTPMQIMDVIRDITERKRAEEGRLAFAVEREKTRILARFIEDVSHEFGTPLSVINTSLYLLEKPLTPEKRVKQLMSLKTQTAYIGELVGAMLTMARLDAGDDHDVAPINLNSLLREVGTSAQSQIDEKGLTLAFDLDDQHQAIQGDAVQLFRALTELVENALRFTPTGGAITLRARSQGDFVAVEVTDTGIGIGEDDLPRIFDRFYRVDQARTRRGAGLGLSIARRIIEAHQGRIEAESVPGQGSTFRIMLPVGEA